MAAPKRNNYYTKRTKNGKELIYDSPEKFLSEATGYFKWCDDNPWNKKEAIKSGTRTGEIIEVPVSRPYTIEGLCVHIGICVKTFYNYENREEFLPVISHIRQVIQQNQIEGAIIGAYNANIISRILGYADKQEPTAEKKADILVIESSSPKTKENLEIIKERLSQAANY
ncbi:MAG: terminase small subunit [Dysgonomonas sp.]